MVHVPGPNDEVDPIRQRNVKEQPTMDGEERGSGCSRGQVGLAVGALSLERDTGLEEDADTPADQDGVVEREGLIEDRVLAQRTQFNRSAALGDGGLREEPGG